MAARRAAALALVVTLTGCAAVVDAPPGGRRPAEQWSEMRRGPSGQAPDPATAREPVIQVYAARALGWRGVFAVHPWIVVKPSGAETYRRYEVIGWGVDAGAPAIRIDRAGPDDHWFGARPELLVDARGDGVDALVAKVEAAVAAYPYRETYRTWPGPNSNTFIAWIGHAVPELRLHLPPTAIGKDYLPHGAPAGLTPSHRGVQLSLLGLAGVLAGVDEGVEVNLLGLIFGLDVRAPALKLPVAGRVGVTPSPAREAR